MYVLNLQGTSTSRPYFKILYNIPARLALCPGVGGCSVGDGVCVGCYRGGDGSAGDGGSLSCGGGGGGGYGTVGEGGIVLVLV